MQPIKPVHQHTDLDCCESNQDVGWCFWDETGDCHGPFESREEAERILKLYCEEVLG